MHVGVDGCKSGWIAIGDVGQNMEVRVHPTFADLLHEWGHPYDVFVDIPIGLPSALMTSRECDQQARKVLGPRASSVFSPPSRAAAYANSYQEAKQLNVKAVSRSLSAQAWGICKKIAEVDQILANDLPQRARVFEVHPELCFWALSGGTPMQQPKKKAAGRQERLALLASLDGRATTVFEGAMQQYLRREVQADDILDAMVALFTGRGGHGGIRTFPAEPQSDEVGLPMRMLCRKP